MTSLSRLIAGWTAIVASVGLGIAAIVASQITGTNLGDPLLAVAILSLGIVGGIVTIRRPGNRMGVVLAVAGVSGALSGLAAGLGSGDSAHDALVGNSFLDAGPIRLIFIALGDAGFFTFFVVTFGLLPLLFPTGRVPSSRWRWLERILVTGVVLAFVLGTFKADLCTNAEVGPITEVCVANPIGIAGLPPTEAVLLLLFPAIVASIVALILRHRRSTGVERLQLKWLTFSMTALIVDVVVIETLLVEVIGLELGPLSNPTLDLFGILVLMVPVSIAVAILRFRLFEIDRLISRSVSYAVVLGVLGAVFAVAVAVPSSLVGGEDAPAWAVAGSTLLVAALFSPVRRRVQVVVDRRFNRSRYDAQRVVAGFGVSLRDAGDLGAVTGSLGTVVMEVFQPSHLGLWVEGEQ